jgi:hypothetical protein
MRGEPFCFWHHPDHGTEAAEARRLGGLRHKRERTLQGAYDFEGLGTIPDIRRLLEIAVLDTLSLENSVPRSRTIGYLAQVAASLVEKGELADRLEAVEGALGPRLVKADKRRR